jgi:hypothetical protein
MGQQDGQEGVICAIVPKPTGFWNSLIKQKRGFRSTVHPAYLPGENHPIKTISEYQILELIWIIKFLLSGRLIYDTRSIGNGRNQGVGWGNRSRRFHDKGR